MAIKSALSIKCLRRVNSIPNIVAHIFSFMSRILFCAIVDLSGESTKKNKLANFVAN